MSTLSDCAAAYLGKIFHDVTQLRFFLCCLFVSNIFVARRDVPVGVPLDLSTPTGMSCIGTYGENCKSDNVSKYRVLLLAFLLLWHEN